MVIFMRVHGRFSVYYGRLLSVEIITILLNSRPSCTFSEISHPCKRYLEAKHRP